MTASTIAVALALAAPLHVTLAAPTHAPRVGTEWRYAVHATRAGKAVAARLTVQIVDPLGGAHAVTFGRTNRKLIRWPFRGIFRDFMIWPRSSRGIPLRLRVTVVAGGTRRVLTYAVLPRS